MKVALNDVVSYDHVIGKIEEVKPGAMAATRLVDGVVARSGVGTVLRFNKNATIATVSAGSNKPVRVPIEHLRVVEQAPQQGGLF